MTIWKLISFGAHVFEKAFLEAQNNPKVQPSVSTTMILRGAKSPPAAGEINLEGDYLVVTALAATEEEYDALVAAVDTTEGQMRKLVGEDDNGKRWYVMARPIQHVRSGIKNIVTFEVPDRVWRSDERVSDSWFVTSSGQEHTLSVGGARVAKPMIRLTPRSAKVGGFGYARWVCAYNRLSTPLANYALDITGGRQLDTAALVGAGKCKANGDDIHVLVNGVDRPRWLVGMNTTQTGIIVTLSFSPAATGTLLTALSSGGNITTIAVKKDTANLTFLKRLAEAGTKLILIDNEIFSFMGVNLTNYTITGVVRAQRGTSPQAHNAGALIRWIEHDIFIVYGNTDAEAPQEDLSLKPIWDIESSTNTQWSWSTFYDSDYPGRPGTWMPSVLQSTGKQSHWYTDEGGEFANPATRMGMRALAFMQNGVWKAETAQIEWRLNTGVGATHVKTTGKKYRYSTSWASFAGLQKAVSSFVSVWNETSPTAAQVWQSFPSGTPVFVSLGGTFPLLRYFFSASVAGTANNSAALQIDTVEVMLDANRTPSVTMGSEQDTYWMDTTIKVLETGEAITIRGICPLNQTLEIDCEKKTVKRGEENAFAMLELSSKRGTWLDLPPGEVTIKVIDEGVSNLQVAVDFEERTI